MKHKTRSKQFTLWIMALTLLLLSGCYNDDKLWDAVNEQEQRIAALETWQKVVNGNIEALQRLVTENDYITTVTPVTLNGETVGYTIAFKTQPPITIYNGAKGDKGEQGEKGEPGDSGATSIMPTISLTQVEDGNWYWTLNGTLMTDAEGKPIRANGKDGKDGTDGKDGQDGNDGKPGQSAPTPQLKTGQELTDAGISGTWTADAVYLSVDDGRTWTKVSGAPGSTEGSGTGGDTMFQSVTTSEDKNMVTFTLTGGATIQVPTWQWAQAIQGQLNNMNNDITAFHTLLNGKKYITKIEATTGTDGKTGQEITYIEVSTDGTKQTEGKITIWDGEKGDKGEQGTAGTMPTISAVQETDGNWYWTVNNNKISDGNDGYVRANGDKGADGAAGTPAPTPQIKLGSDLTGVSKDAENNTIVSTAVYLSVDNSNTWWKISGEDGKEGSTGAQGPQGEKGDSFFSGVPTVGTDYVTFSLTGGSTFTVPRYVELGLKFSQNNIEIPNLYTSTISIDDDPVISYDFVGTESTPAPRVSALFSDADGWKVTVNRTNKTITIAPTAGERELIIMVTDSKGNARNYALMLERGFNQIGENSYSISTAGELEYLAQKVNSGTGYENTSFTLTRDIDLSGRNWIPIGIYGWPNGRPFKGTFDGQEYTISRLTIKSSQSGLGLFGYSDSGATIKNITLLSPQIECGEYSMIGALTGYSYGATIMNCYVKGGEIKSKGSFIGGLIGYCDTGSAITNCHAESISISGTNYAGGLMGTCDGSTVTNCHAKCTVIATGDQCGGLIGQGYTSANLTITACYAKGDVTGNGSSVGGLIGYCYASDYRTVTIKSCYYAGTVTNNASDKPIGFVGSTEGSGTLTFTACYGAFTTGTTGLTSFTGVNYVEEIKSDHINAMNSVTSNSYNSDGTLVSEKKQQQTD
ncbi:PL29 family lyase N-terminal domain-containing protein [Phocaeicola sp.]